MHKTELRRYLNYQQRKAEENTGYRWTYYPKDTTTCTYVSKTLQNQELCSFMLKNEQVCSYPWLEALFTTGDLSSFIQLRKHNNLETVYIDYMGPGDWNIFESEIPDSIFGISLEDKNEVRAPTDFKERTSRVYSNIYDLRKTVRKLRFEGFEEANITTETAKGPLWLFWGKDIVENFPLEVVWEYFWIMFRKAYSLSAQDGSVLVLQIPSINTKDDSKVKDQDIDKRLTTYLNQCLVPTYISGDMMVCVKTQSSPEKLGLM